MENIRKNRDGAILKMIPILVICIIIVFAVILISVLTTSKAYKYKHTIDPHPSDTIDDSHDQ